jgi:lipopolysaccharide/colanic/teichoic acid biosynthesis glycosyltransferase
MPGAGLIKRLMDIGISIALLPFGLLVMAWGSAVLLYHKRHVLQRELRIGKDGKPFWMYRMNVPRDASGRPEYEQFIRELSISEVPQLFNVLRGDMSLVGPRPENPIRVKLYSEWQRERLKVVPGITGLAQVNGLRDESSSEDKTRFDLQYALEWTPFMDVVLLVRTLLTLVKRILPRWKRPSVLSRPDDLAPGHFTRESGVAR